MAAAQEINGSVKNSQCHTHPKRKFTQIFSRIHLNLERRNFYHFFLNHTLQAEIWKVNLDKNSHSLAVASGVSGMSRAPHLGHQNCRRGKHFLYSQVQWLGLHDKWMKDSLTRENSFLASVLHMHVGELSDEDVHGVLRTWGLSRMWTKNNTFLEK